MDEIYSMLFRAQEYQTIGKNCRLFGLSHKQAEEFVLKQSNDSKDWVNFWIGYRQGSPAPQEG